MDALPLGVCVEDSSSFSHHTDFFAETPSLVVVVNLMHQLGWVRVSKGVLKYYPGCFLRVFFVDEINV